MLKFSNALATAAWGRLYSSISSPVWRVGAWAPLLVLSNDAGSFADGLTAGAPLSEPMSLFLFGIALFGIRAALRRPGPSRETSAVTFRRPIHNEASHAAVC
jgi:hypothetical protein